MLEKLLLKLIPNFVKRVEELENKLATERLARKNEVNRVEKEFSSDWVGDEVEQSEKEKMISTLESDEIINVGELK